MAWTTSFLISTSPSVYNSHAHKPRLNAAAKVALKSNDDDEEDEDEDDEDDVVPKKTALPAARLRREMVRTLSHTTLVT